MDEAGGANYFLDGYFSASTLMDLHNNRIGQEMADNSQYSHLTPEQLYEHALKNRMLITDINDSFKVYNLDESYITPRGMVYAHLDGRSGMITFFKEGTR